MDDTSWNFIKSKIEDRCGSFDEMIKEFNNAAAARLGSGWAWLTVDPQSGSLEIMSTPNQDNPFMQGLVDQVKIPILEHVEIIKYLVNLGANINASIVAGNGHFEIVKYEVEYGANISV